MRDNDYNVFYACRDELPTDVPYFSANPSSGFTASPVGFDVTFSSASAIRVNYIYKISEGSHAFYARAIRKTATVVTFVPIWSTADSATAFSTATYTTSATVVVVEQSHVTLPLDLREAPVGGTYDYLLIGSAAVSCDTTAQRVTANLWTKCPSGDRPGGTDRSVALMTVGNASFADNEPWNCACVLTDLKPGTLWEHHLAIAPTGSAGTARMSYGHLAAIRVRERYTVGNANLNSVSSASATLVTDANHSFDLPNEAFSSVNPTWIIVATGVISNDAASNGRVVVDVVGASSVTLLDATLPLRTATDRRSFGIVAMVSALPNGATAPKVSIKVAAPNGGTSTIRRAFLGAFRVFEDAYVPNASLPFEDVFSSLRSGDVAGTTGTSFVATSGTDEQPITGLISGQNIEDTVPDWNNQRLEFISLDVRKAGNGRWEARPLWGGPRVPQQSAHGLWGPSQRGCGFFMHRVPASPVDSSPQVNVNKVENRAVVNDGNPVLVRNTGYVRLQELTPPRENSDSDVELLAEVEHGVLLQDWTQVSGDLYKIPLGTGVGRANIDDVGRVLINGVEATEIFKKPSAASTWYFNPEKDGLPAIDLTLASTFTFDQFNSTDVPLSASTNVAIGRIVVLEDSATGNIAHARVEANTSGNTWQMSVLTRYPGDKGFKFASATTTVRATEGHYLYLQMPTGKTPYPQTSDQRVVIVARERLGRRLFDLQDYRGRTVPYFPRISKVPDISEDFDVRVSGSQVQSSYGTIEVANGDGYYDGLPARRFMEGLPVTLKRLVWDHRRMAQFPWEPKDRAEFVEVLARAFGSLPEVSAAALAIGLFPRGVNLNRPLTAVRNTAFGGNSNETAERGVGIPIVMGPADRVRGRRISRRTGVAVNQYRVSAAMLKQVRAGYLTPTTAQTITIAAPSNNALLLSRGIVSVNNDQNGNNPADELYFDVDGITDDGTPTGNLIQAHGSILSYVLKNFPWVPDATVAGSTTTNANHTPTANTVISVGISPVPSIIYEGARVRITAANGNRWHGHITTLGLTASVWPALEPGDTLDVQYVTGSTFEILESAPLGFADTDLDAEVMRLIDRVWRCQSTSKSGLLMPVPGLAQRISHVFEPETTIQEAVEKIGKDGFFAPYVNRQGRMSAVAPDFDVDGLLPNSSGEEDRVSADGTAGVRPWTAEAGSDPTGQGAPTIEVEAGGTALFGTRCMRLVSPAASGGNVSTTGYAWYAVPCPSSGWYQFVIYILNDSSIATPADFTITVTKPGIGVQTVAKSYVVGTDVFTNRWVRQEVLFYVAPGNVGTAIIKLWPTTISGSLGTTTTTKRAAWWIDGWQLYPVAAVLDDYNSDFGKIEFEDENLIEARVSYLIRRENSGYAFYAGAVDNDARGLAPTLFSEARYTLFTAGVGQIDDAGYADADSAFGTASAVMRYGGRGRQRMNSSSFGLTRIPRMGERVVVNLSRESSPSDRDTTWIVRSVEADGGHLKTLRLGLRRQNDPLFDRVRRVTR